MRNKSKKTPRPVRVHRDQEAVIRQFIEGIHEFGLPVKGTTLHDLYDLLGYKLASNGARVNKAQEQTFKFGESYDPKDEYYDDWQEATDEEIAALETNAESSTSEPTEGAEVREAVLREEV